MHTLHCIIHYLCEQPDQIVGTVSEESLTGESSANAAAESADGTDDVWSREVPLSETEDDKAAAAGHIKRGSLELPDDVLHIKPYVNFICTLVVIVLSRADHVKVKLVASPSSLSSLYLFKKAIDNRMCKVHG